LGLCLKKRGRPRTNPGGARRGGTVPQREKRGQWAGPRGRKLKEKQAFGGFEAGSEGRATKGAALIGKGRGEKKWS